MSKSISLLFSNISLALDKYATSTPSYVRAQSLYDNKLQPDHIAIRSFKSRGGINSLKQRLVENNIYRSGGKLKIPKKHLNAEWFYTSDHEFKRLTPRIFISELDETKLSQQSQEIITQNVDEYTPMSLFTPQNPQNPQNPQDYNNYTALEHDSEYASWSLIHGTQINHIALNTPLFHTLEQMLCNLQYNDFTINSIGGKIKSSPDNMLHQGSTMSDTIQYTFKNNVKQTVPGFFVEFIKRDMYNNGTIREGFEENNALNIFDSTSNGLRGRMD